MQAVLEKLAIFTVIAHMAVGCGWHHGIGAHACEGEHATPACRNRIETQFGECRCSRHDHDASDNKPDAQRQSMPEGNGDDEHGPCHSGCQDDGCNYLQQASFEFFPVDFSTQYLGGAETSVLADGPELNRFEADPYPDCSHTKTSLRAHLLFGVQLL